MRTIRKVAAVIVRGGLLLVVRKHGSSVFLSPGGKREPGETSEQTLARELAEETGLRTRSWRPFGTFSDRSALDPSTTVEIEAFLVEADGVAEPSAEIAEVAWIDARYGEDGIELGSVFGRFIVPKLRSEGLLRDPGQRKGRGEAGGVDMVAADLDGTLAFDSLGPGPAVAAALAELSDQDGVELVFATSRAPRGVRQLLGPLADRATLICCNGAVTVSGGTVSRRVCLPSDTLRTMVDGLLADGADFYLDHGDRFVVCGTGFPWMDYPDRVQLDPAEVPFLERVSLEGVVKLTVHAPGTTDTVEKLRAATGPALELCAHADGVVDITCAGATKAAALAALTAVPTGERARTVASLGNDLNDQEMLGRADIAVVVGDGLPGLERARHVRRIRATDGVVATVLSDLACRTYGERGDG
ncbi:HAD hydrolase family protein [Streptomyces chattanoogensis]|uniref:HAD hydrolase family protein n=1 Tax=Streptomyces chattanoogensis TaxID=66876 RepID=UPI0006B43EFC|nr:HAD hydrolase family protein [Streptomyces chattanoogensis]